MEMVFHVRAAADRTSKDGIIQMWRRWDKERTFIKLHEILNADIAPSPKGPNGWKAGYLLGWSNPGYEENTEYLLDDFTLSTESLLNVIDDEGTGGTKAAPEAGDAPALKQPGPNRGALLEREAASIFAMARQAERMGQRDVARNLFERIVERFPDTEAGKAAAKKR